MNNDHGHRKDGTPITDADVEAMADEAERGYDVDTILRRRRGGPAAAGVGGSLGGVRAAGSRAEARPAGARRRGTRQRLGGDPPRDRRVPAGQLTKPQGGQNQSATPPVAEVPGGRQPRRNPHRPRTPRRPRTFLAPGGRGARWPPGSVARITALVTSPAERPVRQVCGASTRRVQRGTRLGSVAWLSQTALVTTIRAEGQSRLGAQGG